MKNLWYISICLIGLFAGTSCNRHPFRKLKEERPSSHNIQSYFFLADSTCFFKTSIDTYGKSLSGILAIKKQNEDTLKVSFFTEMGVKFFDLIVSHDSYTIVDCIPQLNKPAVMNTLVEDIRWVVLWNVKKLKQPVQMKSDKNEIFVRYQYNTDWIVAQVSESGQPAVITYAYGKKFKSKFDLTYNAYKDGIPSDIQVKHYNFDLTIMLSSVSFNE